MCFVPFTGGHFAYGALLCFCVFSVLVILLRLSVTIWKDSSPKWPKCVLMGTLNLTYRVGEEGFALYRVGF